MWLHLAKRPHMAPAPEVVHTRRGKYRAFVFCTRMDETMAARKVDPCQLTRPIRHPIPAQEVSKLPLTVSLATWDAAKGCGRYPNTPSRCKAFSRV